MSIRMLFAIVEPNWESRLQTKSKFGCGLPLQNDWGFEVQPREHFLLWYNWGYTVDGFSHREVFVDLIVSRDIVKLDGFS